MLKIILGWVVAMNLLSSAFAAPSGELGSTEGVISYYADVLHGNLTASGAVYDKNKMTAAHKTLPFGTRVVVTNLDNGKSVVVLVNDRGPFVAGRIIDVSGHAAEQLGMEVSGLANGRIAVQAQDMQ